jgi:Ca2+-binding EF-hand superfamily protein
MSRCIFTLAIGMGFVLPAPRGRCDDNPNQANPPPLIQQLLVLNADQFIRRFDRNRDGYLTKNELPPRLAAQFDKWDTNADGKLDKKEVDALLQTLRRRFGVNTSKPNTQPANQADLDKAVARMLERMDTNKDGKISRAEAQGPLAKFFDELDQNKDGYLDKTELRRAAARFQAQNAKNPPSKGNEEKAKPPAPRFPDFDALDRNADGRLTRAEVEGTPIADIFDEIDTKKNGKIDRQEYEAYWKKKLPKDE